MGLWASNVHNAWLLRFFCEIILSFCYMFTGPQRCQSRCIFVAWSSVQSADAKQSGFRSLVHGKNRPQDISWRKAAKPSVQRGL